MTMRNQRLPWILAAVAGVAIFAAFAVWGGIPAETNAELFWLQAGGFFLVICAFVLAFWHLLIRPLAPNLRQPQSDTLPSSARETIALVLASGGISIVIGSAFGTNCGTAVSAFPSARTCFGGRIC